jgi:hypothetical protein
MVTGRVDGGDTVDTSWKTFGNIGGQNTVHRGSVETLEESKDFGVQGLRRVESRHQLHGNVAMTLDLTIDQLLRSGIVCVGRVRERSGVKVVDLERDGELGVGSDGIKVLGGVELGGRHVVNGRDVAHGGGVARTSLDLETVGNGLADTEVDEVVRANEGVCLTSSLTLAIDFLDDGRIQCEAGVGVASVGVGRGCSRGR